MVKQAELEIIKRGAFKDELTKLAGPVGMVAKALLKYLPKLLRSGAFKAFGKKGLKFLNKSKGITGRSYRALSRMNRSGKEYTVGKIYREGIGRMAKVYGTRNPIDYGKGTLGSMLRETGNPKVMAKPLTAIPRIKKGKKFLPHIERKTTPSLGVNNSVGAFTRAWRESSGVGDFMKHLPGATLGQASTNLNYINEHGAGKFLRHNLNKARTYTKEIDIGNGMKQKHIFRRSGLGQALNTTMGSPLGWSAGAFIPGGKNPKTGKKRGLLSRTANAGSMLIAPGLTFTGEMAGIVR